MQLSFSFFLVANTILCSASFSNAFSSIHTTFSSVTPAINKSKRSFSSTALFGMIPPQDDHSFDEDDEDFFDVEDMRQRFESLVGSSGSRGDNGNNGAAPQPLKRARQAKQAATYSHTPILDVSLPRAPPLTSIDRERREAEIQMLRQLEYGDESLADLWTLWFQERGSAAGARLLLAEELTAQGPNKWDEAEDVLRGLVDEYGVYWVEPVNRLATLLYMQGRMLESETLCKMVLAIKPWHFGALSGIVMIYAGEHDAQSARQWASRRLPTFAPSGPNRRRAGWVQKAVRDAMESLLSAEKRVVDSFGAPDDHTRQRNNKNNRNEMDDEGDWQ